jgi:hypothetical protein
VLDDLAYFGRRVAIFAWQHDRLGIRVPIGGSIFIAGACTGGTRPVFSVRKLGFGDARQLGHGGGLGVVGVAAWPLGRSSRLREGGLGSILRIHVIYFEKQLPFCTILVAGMLIR